MNSTLRAAPLIVMLLLAAAMALALLAGTSSRQPGEGKTGYSVGAFNVPDLHGRRFSPAIWQGQVAMLNVFASWCLPCAAEHEAVMKIAQSGKVKVYGLAWNDTPAHIAKWIGERGNPYRAIGIDEHGDSTVPLALTGVPETFVFDKHGHIVYHYDGALTDGLADNVILPLVEKLNAE